MSVNLGILNFRLKQASAQWRKLRFLQQAAWLGAALCLLSLFCGLAMQQHWIGTREGALDCFIMIGMLGFIALLVVFVRSFSSSPERKDVTAALEQANPELQDRANTLVFLQKQPGLVRQSFVVRIATQTQFILAKVRSPKVFSADPAMQGLAVFLMTLLATVSFYQVFSPYQRLPNRVAVKPVNVPAQTSAPQNLETMPPETVAEVEETKAWGEVRITDPGKDIKTTPFDMIPMEIEAAANDTIQSVAWFSAVNGGTEIRNELPPPAEARFATYQQTLNILGMNLSDWDVIAYYARATTLKSNQYVSQIYFAEVRPWDEDLFRLKAQGSPKALQSLNELTAMIEQQEQVIRETHRQIQGMDNEVARRAQDRRKLSTTEYELSETGRHLHAEMAADLEGTPAEDAVRSMASAVESLAQSGKLLEENTLPEAQGRELKALAELNAARKMFHKTMCNQAGDGDGDGNSPPPKPPEENQPEENAKKLEAMAEFRNEEKAAQEFVEKTAAQQQSLYRRVATSPTTVQPKLAQEERDLQKSLQEFQEQHPRALRNSEPAQAAMKKAADSLEKKNNDARPSTYAAAQQLEKLAQSMKKDSAQQQLTDAYKLKELLDKQIQSLSQCEQGGGNLSESQARSAATAAQQTLEQLRQAAENSPTREQFGQPLRDALNPENKAALNNKLGQFAIAQPGKDQQQKAGTAKNGMQAVSQAFEQSAPQGRQANRKKDALGKEPGDNLEAGLAGLENLQRRLEAQPNTPKADLQKQGKQIVMRLKEAQRETHASSSLADVIVQLENLFKGELPMDAEVLQRLRNDLQRVAAENRGREPKSEKTVEAGHIDASRLPPAYRGRIEKYFEKLSEKP
ncbi:MAG: hypothetical protein WCO56_24030 [Verrucomicrobiota bacterium]